MPRITGLVHASSCQTRVAGMSCPKLVGIERTVWTRSVNSPTKGTPQIAFLPGEGLIHGQKEVAAIRLGEKRC